MGKMNLTRKSMHVSVQVENNADYARYVINDVLGRLDCPAEPRLLYLKAMYHAYTSSIVPDPLTGRTGSEEAISCLKSGYCQPWSPITEGPHRALVLIAQLTPRRQYYPKELRVMQTTSWDPRLTTTVQQDGYRAIIDELLAKSDELSIFSVEKIDLPILEPKGDDHLTHRSLLRRELYQRPVSWSEQRTIQDPIYESRDHWRASRSRFNVSECVSLLRTWPASFATTLDLAGILQAYNTIGGHNGRFEKVLLTDILEVQIGAEWGSLVNLCRESSISDAYKLIFTFACMAFRQDANIDALKVLIAFTVFTDLKVLSPPNWPVYTQFRSNQLPRMDYLVQLMRPHLISYAGDERSTFGFNLSHKQRKKFEAAELAHEKQQDSDAKLVAEFLLKQWPCAEPQIEDFSTPVLIDIEQALNTIRPEWMRLFQNLELSEYLSWAQVILNAHCTDLAPTSVLSTGDGVEPPIFRMRIRGGELPTLQVLLCQPLLPAHGSAKALPLQERRVNVPKPLEHCGEKMTMFKPQNLVMSKNQRAIVPEEIYELGKIIRLASHSRSAVEKQYADDLAQSLQAFRDVFQVSRPQQIPPTPVMNLSQMTQSAFRVQEHFRDLETSFQYGYPVKWLRQGGLWPAISPITLLENLRSTAMVDFGSGMRGKLIEYALSITRLQRLRRIDEAYQKPNSQRLSEEQKNPGHTNWKPTESPDWLLLEIDSNMLIRASQVDVAMATISPRSGSNSVLQMNMGQGK